MSTTTTTPPIDEARLGALVEQALGDLGSVLQAALVVVGDRLGLYRALVDGGPQTPAQLAERTGTVERNVREWLAAQAAAGYVERDDDRYSLSPEQAALFTDEDSPAFVMGGFQGMNAAAKADELLTEAMRTGRGVGWGEHHHDLFRGTERFFRPAGATVADVGCGFGASTIILGEAYPASTFVGFDSHGPSIDAAREQAAAAGLSEKVRFEVAPAKEITGSGYRLVCYFDCLHDMGDPVGALVRAREVLADDGTVLLVEPYAGDSVEENMTPVGRVFYAASSLICTPASQSQEVGLALGAQAGEARLAEVAREAGFTRVRRAAETPFNLVLELRP